MNEQTTLSEPMVNQKPISFRFVKLGVALALLFISALVQGIPLPHYTFVVFGGIVFFQAFASFGNYDYNGIKSKTSWRIARYALAFLLMAIAATQLYVAIAMPGQVHYTPYTTVVDCAIISYLLMFKPSDTTKRQKAMKTLGYVLILLGANALQIVPNIVDSLVSSTAKSPVGPIVMIGIILAIGITLVVCGSKNNSQDIQETSSPQCQN